MSDIQLIEKPVEKSTKETFKASDLKDKPVKQRVFNVDKYSVSKNIQAFDAKVQKVRSSTPFDYNAISLQKDRGFSEYTPTAQAAILDPTLNTVGKFLGVDTTHEWGKQYDKIIKIVEWAKEKSGVEDTAKIVDWLAGASNVVPSFGMNHKKVDQLYMYAMLQMQKG